MSDTDLKYIIEDLVATIERMGVLPFFITPTVIKNMLMQHKEDVQAWLKRNKAQIAKI